MLFGVAAPFCNLSIDGPRDRPACCPRAWGSRDRGLSVLELGGCDGWPACPEGAWFLSGLSFGAAVARSVSRARLSATPWTAARQASLSFTISRSLLRLTSIQSLMPSHHLILCHPLLLLPSIFPFPFIRAFSNESAL